MVERHDRTFARRAFFSKFGLGLTGGVALGGGAASAQTPAAGGQWQPARHELDDWLDRVPGKHRLVFDTSSPEGIGDALLFVNNFMNANQNAYGIKEGELAIVVVVRHASTPFAYADAMWGKYGVPMTVRTRFNDPKTSKPPTINLYNSKDYGNALNNRANTVEAMTARGVHLAVCQLATRAYAGAIAEATGQTQDAVYNELAANLIGRTAHLVPAGIVAVNRAQERGYSLATAG
jgi:intracellular sulfur oxidation DsrE/DsrF family protein